jgi:peptidoglycan/LPS O-acetylase OafA/YrhL
LALLINICIAFYIGIKLPNSLWQYVFFIQNFTSEMPLFFIESWSLSIEEFAYIVGPLLLYATLFIKTKLSKPKLFLWMTLCVIFLFTISKVIYGFNDGVKSMTQWNSGLKAVVVYRIDAIYYGVLAAYVSIVKPNLWKHFKYISFVFGVLLFLGLNAVIPIKRIFIETHSIFWNVWYLPINSIAIMLTLPLLSQIKTASKFIEKPITYISIISYAMYVLHYSIILQLLKYFLPSEDLPKFDSII